MSISEIVAFSTAEVQDSMHDPAVRMGMLACKTVFDLGSLGKPSETLTLLDRIAILARGIFAAVALPIIALPLIFYGVCLSAARAAGWGKPAEQIHEIAHGLYLGTVKAALSKETLEKHGIDGVISVYDKEINVSADKHARIDVVDEPHVNMKPAIERAAELVRAWREEKPDAKILIHCQMGQSRSATVTTGVLIREHGMDPSEAVKLVRKQRPVVAINYGFQQQLRRMAESTAPGALAFA